MPDGRTLQGRITTIKTGNIRIVRTIIEEGVRRGSSVLSIANQIEAYVQPDILGRRVRPFDLYRQRFGRPKSFVPKGIPAGSMDYNAVRIARTETARTYRAATVDFYKNKDYVDGFDLVMSGSHPKTDECDGYAADSPYYEIEQIPDSHPNCLCDVIPRILSYEEMRELKR